MPMVITVFLFNVSDVDECINWSEETESCENDAICINTRGSFKCQCKDGYRESTMNGIACEGTYI